MKDRIFSFALAALVAAPLLAQPSPVKAANWTPIVSFGDSLSDVGNFYAVTGGADPVSPPYRQGRFTNGPVWVEDLAKQLGARAPQASIFGGSDYAVGGAQTGTTGIYAAATGDLPSQIDAFAQASGGRADPRALYTLWIGANDVLDVVQTVNSYRQALPVLNEAVHNTGIAMRRLAALGVQRMIVANLPDIGKTPLALQAGGSLPAMLHKLSVAYNGLLMQQIAEIRSETGMQIQVLDAMGLVNAAVNVPQAFGLQDVTDSCWTGDELDPASGAVCAKPSVYLFWDQIHPTATGHALIAGAALALVKQQ